MKVLICLMVMLTMWQWEVRGGEIEAVTLVDRVLHVRAEILPHATTDVIGVKSVAPYQHEGEGTIWLPNMPVAGEIRLFNQGQDDYLVYSQQAKADLRDRIVVTGATLGDRYLLPKDLPPLKLDYMTSSRYSSDGDSNLTTLRPGLGAQGIKIRYEFLSQDYLWAPGLYRVTLSMDLFPGRAQPVLIQATFRIKYVKDQDDLQNVLWYHYRSTWRDYVTGLATEQEYRDALKSLDSLIEAKPNDAALRYERVAQLRRSGDLHKANEDLAKVIELLESKKSPTVVPFYEGGSYDETLARLKADLMFMRRYAQKIELIKSLTMTSSATEKQQAIKLLLNPSGDLVPPLILDKIQKLRLTQAVPTLLQVLTKPETSLMWNSNVRAKAWSVLTLLRPEIRTIPYIASAPDDERMDVVAQIQALLNAR